MVDGGDGSGGPAGAAVVHLLLFLLVLLFHGVVVADRVLGRDCGELRVRGGHGEGQEAVQAESVNSSTHPPFPLDEPWRMGKVAGAAKPSWWRKGRGMASVEMRDEGDVSVVWWVLMLCGPGLGRQGVGLGGLLRLRLRLFHAVRGSGVALVGGVAGLVRGRVVDGVVFTDFVEDQELGGVRLARFPRGGRTYKGRGWEW